MDSCKSGMGTVDPGTMLVILERVEGLLNGIWTDSRLGGAEGEPVDRAAEAVAAAKRLSWCISRALPSSKKSEHPEPVFVFPTQRL